MGECFVSERRVCLGQCNTFARGYKVSQGNTMFREQTQSFLGHHNTFALVYKCFARDRKVLQGNAILL